MIMTTALPQQNKLCEQVNYRKFAVLKVSFQIQLKGKSFMINNETTLTPAFEQNNVPVVIAVNNLFAPYAGVFIQSLLDHANEKNNYDIVAFQRDISSENKRLLKSLVARHKNVSIRFYDPSPLFASFNYTDEKHHFPLEVYFRIISPHILNYPGRIITVDVDTLLKADIARLINEDLDGYAVGGVCDLMLNGVYLCGHTSFSRNVTTRDYFQDVCGFDSLKNYVNGGLLLFDREKFVRELGLETILNTMRQGKYIYEEQDTLNVLMKGKIKALDFAWNVCVRLNEFYDKFIDVGAKQYGDACERAYENPYLLHWGGQIKPWVCADVPWGGEWWQTALKTPFVGHIIARMSDAQEKRRAYFRKRYGKEIDVWDPSPKGID